MYTKKSFDKYNQIMDYTPSHVPGIFTPLELDIRRKNNELLKLCYLTQEENKDFSKNIIQD